ncbi:MAG: Rap1a/Tai family immunity protein [Candidatus Sulfotelmatobacter sp.]
MKILMAILLLCGAAVAQDQRTTGDFHRACNSSSEFLNGYTLGYVSGLYAGLPDTADLPVTTPRGDVRDAVCQYVAQHPELWTEPYSWGVSKALWTLYPKPKAK